MNVPAPARQHRRPPRPLLFALATVLLLLLPAAAWAADGVPLYPPGIDAGYTECSMENADMSGRMLAFELRPMPQPTIPPPPTPARSRGFTLKGTPIVYLWNAASGGNWNIGGGTAGWTPSTLQEHPTVLYRGGVVYVVWQQRSSAAAQSDLWIWKGSTTGAAAAGYPRLLVRGPANTDQLAPDLGVVTLGGGSVVWLAWEDERDTGGATAEVYVCALSADTDHDGTPDFEEAGFDPATAGPRMDPSGDLLQGQRDAAVGAKGVFWIDDRAAAGSGEGDVWRGQPFLNDASAAKFTSALAGRVKLATRATSTGAAWLGPGRTSGSPYQPWVKDVGGTAHVLTWLGDPWTFDVSGGAYALTGRHAGSTDLDRDIFFYSKATKQQVAVCNVSGAPAIDARKTQAMPTISTATGGQRVVWSDARGHWANTAGTAEDALAYRLYTALVPTVSLGASRTSLPLGATVTLTGKVAPAFAGFTIRFQKGKRHVAALGAYGTDVWYSGWTTLKGKALGSTSKASWTWRPAARGTYWVRVWFVGGKKYTDVGTRKVPHVPNTSRVVKIVVH